MWVHLPQIYYRDILKAVDKKRVNMEKELPHRSDLWI